MKPFGPYTAHCLARLLDGQALAAEEIGKAHEAYRTILTHLGGIKSKSRREAMEAALVAIGSKAEALKAIADADPKGPAPDADTPQAVSADDEKLPLEARLSTLTDEEIGLVHGHEVKPKCLNWLWRYRVSRGKLTVIAGDGGKGKTLLGLWMAAQVSRRRPWPDGSGNADLGQVVILSAEDSPEDTLAPRLIAMGADMHNIKFQKARVVIKGKDDRPLVHPMSLQNLAYWNELFSRVPNCQMFFVDGLPGYLGRGVNDSKNSEVRNIMEPFLSEVIEPRGVAMVSVTHLNKAVDATTPSHRILGSVAYVNLPRNVHVVSQDPDDPERRIFKQIKCNIAPDDLPALAFRVRPAHVVAEGGELIECIVPEFEDDPVVIDARSLMGGGKSPRGPKPTVKLELAKWLVNYLSLHPNGVRVGTIMDAAGEAGLIGTCGTDKQGRERWSGGNSLYRAKDAVPSLVGDHSGHEILETSDKDFRGYTIKAWKLSPASDEELPPGLESPRLKAAAS